MKIGGLGKGLSTLIPDTYINEIQGKKIDTVGLEEIPVGKIHASSEQPREFFDEVSLKELMDSIREKGILQPLIVKRDGEGFEIICGERRFRAAQALGLQKVPAVIRDAARGELLELALIENIQREDLNAVEEAHGYLKLLEERGLAQEEIAKRVGKDRTTVVNSLRLLRLPEEVLGMIQSGRITSGHGRALLGLPTHEYQKKMARRVVEEGLSVRQVEDIVSRGNAGKRRAKRARMVLPEILDLETKLAHKLGTQVKIYNRGNKGRLEIRYFSLDDLDRILDLLQIRRD